MTDQEKINENLQRQIDAQNARIDNVLTKVDMLVIESQQQREDIRRLSEKHEAEIKAAQEKHEAEMHEMNQRFYEKFDDITKQLHSNFIQTMLGVGAIMVAVGGLIIAVLK